VYIGRPDSHHAVWFSSRRRIQKSNGQQRNVQVCDYIFHIFRNSLLFFLFVFITTRVMIIPDAINWRSRVILRCRAAGALVPALLCLRREELLAGALTGRLITFDL